MTEIERAIASGRIADAIRLTKAETVERCAQWLEASDQSVLAENMRLAFREKIL